MLCSQCNERQATVHFTIVVNGSKTEVYLCDACAKESAGMYLSEDEEFLLDTLLTGMFSEKLSVQDLCSQQEKGEVCLVCGSSLHDIAVTGKIGCSECFNVFKESLQEIIKSVQGTLQYEGKRPRGQAETSKDTKIARLKDKLDAAVRKEEYEIAAQLRDEIIALQKETENVQPDAGSME